MFAFNLKPRFVIAQSLEKVNKIDEPKLSNEKVPFFKYSILYLFKSPQNLNK
jgi:hypothetical protein